MSLAAVLPYFFFIEFLLSGSHQTEVQSFLGMERREKIRGRHGEEREMVMWHGQGENLSKPRRRYGLYRFCYAMQCHIIPANHISLCIQI